MKILLPVDGSEHTKRMLAYLAAHDELLAGTNQYTFFTAVAAIPNHAARFLDRSTLDAHYATQAEEVFTPLRQFAQQNHWTFDTVHTSGHSPADSIAAIAAKLKPGLIVMGTHGHSSLGNVVMGSVATGVIARCKTPVLLIP